MHYIKIIHTLLPLIINNCQVTWKFMRTYAPTTVVYAGFITSPSQGPGPAMPSNCLQILTVYTSSYIIYAYAYVCTYLCFAF